MRSSFVFLPFSGECFVDRRTHEKYKVDFFDHQTWIEYGLSPSVSDVGERASPTPENNIDNAKDQVSNAKHALPPPGKVLEPRMQKPTASGARKPLLQHNRDEAIAYLKRTLAETKKFKEELELPAELSSLAHPPLAVVYAVNTPTVRGALVDGREEIKQGNWWDFVYGPGDGVVLAKSAQLPDGFVTVAKIRSQRGHIQLMSDLKAMGTAIEAVVTAKQNREEGMPPK
jgi:hypothetical protein